MFAASIAVAQSPAFDAASLRSAVRSATNRPAMKGGPGTSDPGRIDYHAATLQQLLKIAYALEDYQITGPDWIATDAFDLAATLPPGASKKQFSSMLQDLLKERFRLVAHTDHKKMQVYDLTVAGSGPKLKVADPSSPAAGMAMVPMANESGAMTIHLLGAHATMAALATYLSRAAARPVLDQTGLEGAFDINLSFAPDSMPAASNYPGNAAIVPAGDTLRGALKSQLGLELKSREASLEVLVIDRVERIPSEN